MLKKKVIFFDLFYTLITPQYYLDRNENDVINLTTDEWETFAEDIELYLRRATGKVKDEVQIIEEIISKSGLSVTSNEKEEILKLRKNRIEVALTNIDKTVYEVLSQLKKENLSCALLVMLILLMLQVGRSLHYMLYLMMLYSRMKLDMLSLNLKYMKLL